MCSKSKSSFNGRIHEIPGIALDNFEDNNLKSQAFFLSHCHTDHTQGLFSRGLREILKKGRIYIYTSELSRHIIADDCANDGSLMQYIKALPLGTSHIPLPDVFNYDETVIRVTVAPAGHCLGSVMFLIQTTHCSVLYTGDFNLSTNDLHRCPHFQDENGQPLQIDTIYVDTTFISPRYEYFPKRSEVMTNMISIFKDWLASNENNYISLNTSAKYGYEFVFNQILKQFGQKVLVPEERWKFYREHQSLISAMTNDECDTHFHVCRDSNENGSHRFCGLENTNDKKFLFVRFSAMKWDHYEIEDVAVNRTSSKRLDVCFPTHCSRSQIIGFVNYFSPKNVVGFPNEYPITSTLSPGNNVPNRKRKIDSTKKQIFNVKDKKVDKHLLKCMFHL